MLRLLDLAKNLDRFFLRLGGTNFRDMDILGKDQGIAEVACAVPLAGDFLVRISRSVDFALGGCLLDTEFVEGKSSGSFFLSG